jgi:hypothetical protein
VSDAQGRGWGPGWPNCQVGSIVTLTRSDGLRQPIRREIAALVAWLIDETERRGYDVRPDWTWGYACRAIRGSNTASNHSWGLAIDINAPTNPMLYGKPGWQALHDAGRTDMPAWMPPLWNQYGFRWGGDYASRQDAMHYEFMGTPADAAAETAKITQPEDDMYTDGDRARDVQTAQRVDRLWEDYGRPGKGVRQVIAEIAQRTKDIASGKRPTKG